MLKKIICVLTATRAEYGLLKPLIVQLNALEEFDVRIVATGMHLSAEFGYTYREIEADGFLIDKKIEILLSSDTAQAMSKSMALAMIGFADYFAQLKPNLLFVLGDRYETLAVALAAMNQNIAIAHLYGGEATFGMLDEAIRHAITKISYLHFTSTEAYRKRVIQLGEHPSRVFNVGALGVENSLKENLLSKEQLAKSLQVDLSFPYAVVTFHPVTLENHSAAEQVKALLEVLKKRNDLNFIITKANADKGGRVINQLIDDYAQVSSHIFAFTSLGMRRYLSAVKYAKMVIGNSSSGIIEVPSFGIPTINIGDRQMGRMQADSVINCLPVEEQINQAIALALSEERQQKAKNTKNPYEKEGSSQRIAGVVKDFLLNDKIALKKEFYDLDMLEE